MRVGRTKIRVQAHGLHKFITFLVIVCAVAGGSVWYFGFYRPEHAQGALPGTTASSEPTRNFTVQGQTAASLGGMEEPSAQTSGYAQAMPSASAVPAAQQITGETAFLGNSMVGDLYLYGFIPEADYFYKVGLNVGSAFDTPAQNGTVPILEELKGKEYGRVFLMFGANELGWVQSSFVDDYRKIIDQVKQDEPGAQIYLLSVLPMTQAVSQKGTNGVTQEHADEFNDLIEQLAQETGCIFVDADSVLKDSSGYLPSEASSDGLHLNKTYVEKWAQAIRDASGMQAQNSSASAPQAEIG